MRDGNTKDFFLAESYDSNEYTPTTIRKMKKLLKLAQEKNKFLNFDFWV